MNNFLALCLLIMVIVSGCNSASGDKVVYKSNKNLPQLKAEWEEEYAAWKALEIENYEYVVEYNWKQKEKITIKEGILYSVFDFKSEQCWLNTGSETPIRYHDATMEGAFDHISGAFYRDENHIDIQPGHVETSFLISYDPVYHYPVECHIVHVYNKPVGGNSYSRKIQDFTLR